MKAHFIVAGDEDDITLGDMNQDKGLDSPRAWTAQSTLHTSVGDEVEAEGRERGYTLHSLRIWLTNQVSLVTMHTHRAFKLEPHKRIRGLMKREKKRFASFHIIKNALGGLATGCTVLGAGLRLERSHVTQRRGKLGFSGRRWKFLTEVEVVKHPTWHMQEDKSRHGWKRIAFNELRRESPVPA